ncbi:MAG: L-seryl-tRNA(Sec) selenium transferase [Nitrospirae bacterium]|nr:MAG: L-seryl-tRNA(Sec) selenium transferase [Nitrospirota bacterium]
MTPEAPEKQKKLSLLPSVDEVLKSPEGNAWLSRFQRKVVVRAIRETLAARRAAVLSDRPGELTRDSLIHDIQALIGRNTSFSLQPVINATGIVLHTNLGRSVLSDKVLSNVVAVSRGYSNLEYDLEAGRRGKRHTHTRRLLREITGAEDAFIVNNNAAAVFLCLNTLAADREVIVSRSELVEIGGSFRVPDVMAASHAVLREIGTTNKTHLQDYSRAISDNTALLLKVHQSNYRIIGFTQEVGIRDLVALAKKQRLPVMYDLGSGCLVDLKPFGIHTEPTVQEIVRSGVDVLTFSGDKLLGGPQGGIIVGKKKYIEKIQKNPLARALRVDKLTIAAFEAVLMEYMDETNALAEIPVLKMLFQPPEEIRARAMTLASKLKRAIKDVTFTVMADASKAGGGSLPEVDFPTFAVSIRPAHISVNELEHRLRGSSPPVIARIKGDKLLLDARTIRAHEIKGIVDTLTRCLS